MMFICNLSCKYYWLFYTSLNSVINGIIKEWLCTCGRVLDFANFDGPLSQWSRYKFVHILQGLENKINLNTLSRSGTYLYVKPVNFLVNIENLLHRRNKTFRHIFHMTDLCRSEHSISSEVRKM